LTWSARGISIRLYGQSVRKRGTLARSEEKGRQAFLRGPFRVGADGRSRDVVARGATLQAEEENGCTALHKLVFNCNHEFLRYSREQKLHCNVTVDYRSELAPWSRQGLFLVDMKKWYSCC